MNGKYSQPVEKAVDLIWTSFDREEIRRGYAMLMQAAQKGDADALAFIARCFMGDEYVWSGAGFTPDDANASKLMQRSAMMGSATGVLCAVRSGNLTPAVQRGMPFASFKEAFDEILSQAEQGNAFCCYMIGNVYYWGDYLLVDPELPKQFQSVDNYNAWAYPIAKEWYERSFNGRICAGWGNYCDIRKSGLCDIAQEVFETYYQTLAEISPVICNNYGHYLGYEKNNHPAALTYYAKAAYRGDPQGAYNAGHTYEAGEDVEENIDVACQFYEMAARGGHPAGQFEMGYYHFEGCGSLEQDYAKAVQWFEQAYENPKCSDVTRSQAAAYLGICCQDGLGVVQDDDAALEYLQEAEESIDNLWDSIKGKVLNALGVAYAFGRGTDEDIELGYQYFEDAAELDSEEAKEHLQYLNSSDCDHDAPTKQTNETDLFYENLTERIKVAAEKDLHDILKRIGNEEIYTAALVTDSDCLTLFLAINTIEHLKAEENDQPDNESKWHPDEWGYSDGPNSELSKLSKLLFEHSRYQPEQDFFINAVMLAMKQLKESGTFGKNTDKITFFVSISDDENATNIEDYSAILLNTPQLSTAFLDRDK
ncbi:MAG: DUF4303 domain-containing protein [Muribaculaceae bacterium]|nr:DUF4303 domain-containing protein [Muribaculaceae bacterium]